MGIENLVFQSVSSILGYHEKQNWGFTRLAGRALVRVKTAFLSLRDEDSGLVPPPLFWVSEGSE